MRFHMETFVLLDFFRMNKSEPEYPDEVISDECVKFYVFRALELFERSRGIFSNPDRISIHERAKLVAVCLRLVFNLYRSRTWGYDTFYVYLGRMFLLPKVKKFEEQFKKMEWDACNAMGFTLMPGVARDQNDMVYKGSHGALMTETVEYHIKNLKMLNAVSNLAVSYQCEHFLFKKTEVVPEELKSIHKGILKLAKQDNFFSMSLRNLFVTDGKAVEDTYLDLNWACKVEMRPEAVQRILEQMVSETMDARRTDYTLILASMTALRDTVLENPNGFPRERFDYIRNEIAHNTALQLIAEKELDVIGLIHEGSVGECRNILKSVDDLGTEALEKIKVSGRSARGCRKEVQKVSNVKCKGSARGEFTRVELGSCTILTRVSSDPFKTPTAGVNHRVTCIPGPRRNLVKKVYKYSDDNKSPPELVRVEVSQTYSKACELMAAAYSARCNAADSADLAASEQAILDITSAEDCIDLAAAASAAAAAANAAARAAEAADAAAAAAWSALEMEIESELASEAGGK